MEQKHLSHHLLCFLRRKPISEVRGRKAIVRLLSMVSRFQQLRNLSIKYICSLEGGAFYSETLRLLMLKYYNVEIGRYSYGPCLMPGGLPSGTRVGNFCSIASGVKVLRRNHPITFISLHPFFFNAKLGLLDHDAIPPTEENPLSIMHDAWIGASAIITPRCRRIGIGSVVGAGTVVTRDVPDFTIVAGNPMREIKKRFCEKICIKIKESHWWEYSLSQLLPVFPMFSKTATLENTLTLCAHLKNMAPK